MELKTLKDMPEAISTMEHPFKDWGTWKFIEGILRQEAINWLKKNNDDFLVEFCMPEYFTGESIERDFYANLVKQWIMHFFRISKEDLQ